MPTNNQGKPPKIYDLSISVNTQTDGTISGYKYSKLCDFLFMSKPIGIKKILINKINKVVRNNENIRYSPP